MFVIDLQKRVPVFGSRNLQERFEALLTGVLEFIFLPDITVRVTTPADGLQIMEVSWGGAHGTRLANTARLYQGAVQASMLHFPKEVLAQLKSNVRSWDVNSKFYQELRENGVL